MTENERIKICDFGFSRIAAQNEDEMRRMSYCGTEGFMAPEYAGLQALAPSATHS